MYHNQIIILPCFISSFKPRFLKWLFFFYPLNPILSGFPGQRAMFQRCIHVLPHSPGDMSCLENRTCSVAENTGEDRHGSLDLVHRQYTILLYSQFLASPLISSTRMGPTNEYGTHSDVVMKIIDMGDEGSSTHICYISKNKVYSRLFKAGRPTRPDLVSIFPDPKNPLQMFSMENATWTSEGQNANQPLL